MNVFACDQDPVVAAQSLADRHIVKMVLETAQILSTVADSRGQFLGYRPTHRHHPVVRVANAHDDYLSWVILHGFALANEYTFRYLKIHKSRAIIEQAAKVLQYENSPSLINAPMCMPAELRQNDVVSAYKVYLCVKYTNWGTKARWTRRAKPIWL